MEPRHGGSDGPREQSQTLGALWSLCSYTSSASRPRHSSVTANPKTRTIIFRGEEFGGKTRSRLPIEEASQYLARLSNQTKENQYALNLHFGEERTAPLEFSDNQDQLTWANFFSTHTRELQGHSELPETSSPWVTLFTLIAKPSIC